MTTPPILHYQYLATPIGKILVAGLDHTLHEIRLPIRSARRTKSASPDPTWKESRQGLAPILKQLREYFAGKRTRFDLDLAPQGTQFQLAVWKQLRRIAFGKTISYAGLATRIGNPTACRAVGAANGRNPIPIVIPCHRVIGSKGDLTGYGGGVPAKQWLLKHEGVKLLASLN